MNMQTAASPPSRTVWNKGKLVGQKSPLRTPEPKHKGAQRFDLVGAENGEYVAEVHAGIHANSTSVRRPYVLLGIIVTAAIWQMKP